jgi:ATP-dependent Clp protease adaptor protein ClpS
MIRGLVSAMKPPMTERGLRVVPCDKALRAMREGTIGRAFTAMETQWYGQNGAVPSTVPSTREEVDIAENVDVSPDSPWVVIVWNDPINLMSYVTFVLRKLFGYSLEKATQLMLDVHHKGRAVVSSGPRERAELDVYRLHEHGLWATMQKDGNDK